MHAGHEGVTKFSNGSIDTSHYGRSLTQHTTPVAMSRRTAEKVEEEEPEELICPITCMMFRDPVVTMGGHTYERAAIKAFWASKAKCVDPNTNQLLSDRTLITNWDKRKSVSQWLDAHPESTPHGWDSRDRGKPEEGSRSVTEAAPAEVGRAQLYLPFALPQHCWAYVLLGVGVLSAWLTGVSGHSGFEIPSNEFGVTSGIGLLVFGLFWNCFVFVWTCGAASAIYAAGGRAVFFPLFSVPFWMVGGALLRNGIMSILYY